MSEKPTAGGCGWAVLAFIAGLLFLSFICTNGWGRFS